MAYDIFLSLIFGRYLSLASAVTSLVLKTFMFSPQFKCVWPIDLPCFENFLCSTSILFGDNAQILFVHCKIPFVHCKNPLKSKSHWWWVMVMGDRECGDGWRIECSRLYENPLSWIRLSPSHTYQILPDWTCISQIFSSFISWLRKPYQGVISNFDTNEYPNIFVSKHWYEWIAELINMFMYLYLD